MQPSNGGTPYNLPDFQQAARQAGITDNQRRNQLVDVFKTVSPGGWRQLKQAFLSKKPLMQELLRVYKKVRQQQVKQLLQQGNQGRPTTVAVAGSDSLTSDYDTTLVDPNAAMIVKKIIQEYFQRHHTLPSFVYDANFYPVGYFNAALSNPRIATPIPGSPYSIVLDQTVEDRRVCATYALIRVVKGLDYLAPEWRSTVQQAAPGISSLFDQAGKTQKTNERQITRQAQSQHLKQSNTDPSIKETYARYMLMCDDAARVEASVFNKDLTTRPRELMELVCRSQYFAIESYYTPMTVLIVVNMIQMKMDVDSLLTPFRLLCAVLENLGDLLEHVIEHSSQQATRQQNGRSLLDFSKYLYRILRCLEKMSTQSSVRPLVQQMQSTILPRRGTSGGTITEAQMKRIFRRDQVTLGPGFQQSIADYALDLLQAYGPLLVSTIKQQAVSVPPQVLGPQPQKYRRQINPAQQKAISTISTNQQLF
jgi:hypothetical protein